MSDLTLSDRLRRDGRVAHLQDCGELRAERLLVAIGREAQARVACDDIGGDSASADYGAIPRVVFSDPEVAAVGLTEAQARERGVPVAAARIKLAEAIARPWTYEQDPRGELGLLADREREVLVGAWAVAPLAGEWIHYAALAIKTQTPLAVLRDTVAQFPTFTEAYLKALAKLEPV